MRSFEENLRLYAKLIVQEGLGLAHGQELLVYAEIDQAPLVRLVAEEAYRTGSKHVEVVYRDAEITRIRMREGSDEAINYAPSWHYEGVAAAHRANAARLAIMSTDPGLLSAFPADRIAASSRAQGVAGKPVNDLVSSFAMNWCLVGAASPAWAKVVFPDLNETEATAKLWDKILSTSRVFHEDPIAAWVKHSEALEAKVRWLDELSLDSLHFRAPGTDLRIGLVENQIWAGGRGRSKNGILCSPNIPTEEVFCMPHRLRVDGHVSSTMPLSLRGQIVDEIRMEFKDGVAVQASASKGEETLLKLLSTDEGAKRLGEVALVPNSSEVSKANTLFYNSLYDENAACHIALGASYAENLKDYDELSDEERLEIGANDSLIHVDWMIGSGQIDVDGIRKDGSIVALMRSGEWAE